MRGHVAACAALLLLRATPAFADDPLLEKIDAIAKEVSKLRGLPIKKPIASDVVDKDEIHARMLARFSDAKSQLALQVQGLVLARWGELPQGTDYPKLVVDLLTEQISGYYDYDTKKLTIAKSAASNPGAEMVLAHELDHGLADQAFDLKKVLDLPDGERDASLAHRALVEGDGIAEMVEVTLAHQPGTKVDWTNPEVASAIQTFMDQGLAGCDPKRAGCKPDLFEGAPLAVREQMNFPYRSGFKFVAALRHRQTWAAVDAAYKKPPRSTEQVLHPERYLAGDEPVPVSLEIPPSLAGEWTVGASTVWGELGFSLFLRAHGVDQAMAADAAAGWGGDRMIVLEKGSDTAPEHAVAIARLEWDSEADAIEAAEAATRAVDHLVAGATIDRGQSKTRWVGFDGQVAWVERKGPSVVIVVGAPAALATPLATEVWALSKKKRSK